MRALLPMALLLGCVEPLEEAAAPTSTPLSVGESRTVELRFLRFDVSAFQQKVTLTDLRAISRATLDDVWLLDLPIQRFAENSLAQLRDMDALTAADQPVPVQNMRRLMNMTPDNANLVGTNLEALTALSRSLGIPPQRTLARILQKATDEPVISLEVAARAGRGAHRQPPRRADARRPHRRRAPRRALGRRPWRAARHAR